MNMEPKPILARGPALLHGIWILALAVLIPWPAAQAAPAFQSAQTANATTTSLTINKPTGVVQNDLLIATLAARGNTTITAPAGWTQVQRTNNGTNETLAIFYRVATATDIAATNYVFTLSASVGVAGAILRYTGADPRFPIDASAIATGNSANATAPAVTTTVADTTVVRVAGIPNNGALTVPAGTTQRVNIVRDPAGNTNDTRLGVADATQAAAGATGTAAFTNTSGAWVAATLAIRPYTGEICANPPSSGTTALPAGVYNRYYPGTATANAGAVSITVGASTGAGPAIAVGDLLLVIQMQDAAINTTNTGSYGDGDAGDPATGATNYNNAGKYELVVAKSAVGTGGGTVQIEGKGVGGGLLNTYTHTATATATQGQRRFQVVRVPQYYDATITGAVTSTPWNGTSGGIVALDVANTLTFSGGSINVNAQGFRGGGGQQLTGGAGANTDYRTRVTVNTNGNKAEGVAGSPNSMYDGTATLATGTGYPDGTNTDASRARGAPGNAGGGGTDGNPAANDQNSGGGGGGNGGAGGQGGNTWSSNLPRGGFGGAVFPHATDRLALGGGGGSGARNNSTGVQSSGGRGGGLILIRANSITGTATLSANGGVGVTPANDGGGGGGAGGSVLVFARTGTLTGLSITANGGNGTNADPTGVAHGPGGGGGGGVIYLSSAAGSTSVAGGANGTTTAAAIPFGATPGTAGAVNTVTESGIPGIISGATCKATLASVSTFSARVEGGRVLVEWETASELGTAGFHLERLDPVLGRFERVNQDLLPALIDAPSGGAYSYLDADAWPGQSYTYRLVEEEVWGDARIHGPYTVTPAEPAWGRAAARSAPRFAEDEPAKDLVHPRLGYAASARRELPAAAARALPASAARAARGNQGAKAAAATLALSPPVGLSADKVQIPVRADGLYYLSAAELAQTLGLTETAVVRSIRRAELRLSNRGQAVAWLPAENNAGVYFFGESIDSLYTLDNIYRVEVGSPGVRMRKSPAREVPPAVVPTSAFNDVLAFEVDRFAATVVATDPSRDYWYWEAFIGGEIPGWSAKTLTFQVPEVAGGGVLRVFLKGASTGSHAVSLSLNGEFLAEGTWEDLADHELRLALTPAQLRSGDNQIELRALGTSANLFYLDRIEVAYRRWARALEGRLTLTAEASGPFTVDGFSSPEIRVLDITDPKTPRQVIALTLAPGAVGQAVTFTAGAGRRYIAVDAVVITAAAPRSMTAGDLGSVTDRVDYLVIAPPELRDAAQSLADYRQTTGLASRVVGTEEIYDSFNWGIASPEAIREGLRHLTPAWGIRYVALVGPGSFDYRDLGGRGEPRLPTLMTSTPQGLYACDNCLVDFDGDGAPNLSLGRIPALSPAEVDAYRAKLAAHEQGLGPLDGAGAVLAADKADPAVGDFRADSEDLATLLPAGMALSRIYLDELAITPARSALIGGINQGAGWVNFLGHGGSDRLSAQGLLTVNDLGALVSAGRLPVVSALTCAANRFEVPGYPPLGARLTLDPDGGAIAVWSPTGLSLNAPAVELGVGLLDAVFRGWAPTLGEAVRDALQANAGQPAVPSYLLRVYTLLGDPAVRLIP